MGLKPSERLAVVLGVLAVLFAATAIALGVLLAVRGPPCVQEAPPAPAHAPADLQNAQDSSSPSPALQAFQSLDSDFPWSRGRLSPKVRPIVYDLWMFTDVERGTFEGRVTITVRPENGAGKEFAVHASKLNITHVSVGVNGEDNDVTIDEHFQHPTQELYVIRLKEAFEPDRNYSIYFEFDGSLLRHKNLYRGSYTDKKTGSIRYFVATNFQPTYARRAFPCFDEPTFKSVFRITIKYDRNLHVLSNMPPENTKLENGFHETTFAPTPPMVTYLVCFFVSDFAKLTNRGIFSVYARPDQIKHVEFALEFGTAVHNLFEEYFDIPYPLPKQDLVAIPDFEAFGMENWGLITFSEEALLLNERITPTAQLEFKAIIVAHELAHQWFGNLVTMKWWNDLWLNEGFSTFFSYYALVKEKRNWSLKPRIVLDTLHDSYQFDDIATTHPIIQTVEHVEENKLFDDISYRKGSAVIRMMEGFMQHANFKRGIQDFLKKFAFKSATTKDLWEAMEAQTPNLSISTVMDTWTLQKGYPVVSIRREGQTFTASQEPFLKNSSHVYDKNNSPYGYLWEIPLSYRLAKHETPTVLWMHTEKEVSFDIPIANSELVKFNSDTMGYYRVNYDIESWDAIIKVLKKRPTSLTVEDRIGLLSDAFALAEADLLSYEIPLKMLSYLKKEYADEPWAIAVPFLNKLQHLLVHSGDFGRLREKIFQIAEPVMNKFHWKDNGSISERTLRARLMPLLCSLQYPQCIQKTTTILKEWLNGRRVFPANFMTSSFIYGLKHSSVKEWEDIWDHYVNETSVLIRHQQILGLATTSIPWLLYRLLDYSFNETLINPQEFLNLITQMSKNTIGQCIAWNYVRNRWDDFVIRYKTDNNWDLDGLVIAITRGFSTEIQLKEVEQFLTLHPDSFTEKEKNKALHNVKANIAWLEKHNQTIHDWLMTDL